MKFRSGVLTATCVAILAACASTPPVPAAADSTLLALDRSAAEVSRSITALAEVEQYDRFKRLPEQPSVYEQIPGMTQVVTMPWDGPAEAAGRQLATQAGYVFKVAGKPPVIPVLVQLSNQPATISDLLRNVGLQAGSRADIYVYPAQRIVELRYSDAGI